LDEIKQVTLGTSTLVDLVMVADGEKFEVGVCPSEFFDDISVTFAKGDQLEITGSKVQVGETSLVLAREIVKGNDKVTLRDKQGGPVWMWMK
jgi:hypothetical protein